MRRLPFLVAVLAIVATLPACSRTAASTPPESRLDRADLAGAADRTLAARRGRAEVTVRVETPGGDVVTAHGDGGFDLDAGRRWLRLDLGPLVHAAGGEGAGLARAGLVVDGDHLYVLQPEGRWRHVEAPGAGHDEAFASVGPDGLVRLLGGARDGRMPIPDGALPGIPTGGDVGVDVTLDGRGRVRRMVLVPDLPAGSLSVTVELRDLGAPVSAPVPSPDDVAEPPVG